MKYIITEVQDNRLRQIIWNYLDTDLTPYEGWRNRNDYATAVDFDGEIFLHLYQSEGWGEDPHMWYSTCDNHNLDNPIPEGECPVVTIPSFKARALEDYFGNMWKPIFLEWFNSNTKLPIVKVESQDW